MTVAVQEADKTMVATCRSDGRCRRSSLSDKREDIREAIRPARMITMATRTCAAMNVSAADYAALSPVNAPWNIHSIIAPITAPIEMGMTCSFIAMIVLLPAI